MDAFTDHIVKGVWELLPVTHDRLLRVERLMRSAPANIYIRARDAIHLVTALDAEEREIWTNDRHLLAAAAHFGITGRSAGPELAVP
jgi:predicted nucleic acid-binding protein